MPSAKQLILKQLDEKTAPLQVLNKVQIPAGGWISYVRNSLNMTLAQLGMRLETTRQGVHKMEEREANGAITLKAMEEIASAFGCKFVYGIIPHESFQKMVNERAETLARKIVMRTHGHMVLEAQGNTDKRIEEAIAETADELKREMSRALWD